MCAFLAAAVRVRLCARVGGGLRVADARRQRQAVETEGKEGASLDDGLLHWRECMRVAGICDQSVGVEGVTLSGPPEDPWVRGP